MPTKRELEVDATFGGCYLTTLMTVQASTLSPLSEYDTRSGRCTRMLDRREIVKLIADLSAALVTSADMWEAHLTRENERKNTTA